MNTLKNSPLRPYTRLGMLPSKGIYVFYEAGSPIYVGRTNRMYDRLKEHGRASSGHNSAPFAFNLAKQSAMKKGMIINKPRTELEKDPAFSILFSESKTRISKMAVRVIAIDDPLIQTLFEVYASLELKTNEFNNFDNH